MRVNTLFSMSLHDIIDRVIHWNPVVKTTGVTALVGYECRPTLRPIVLDTGEITYQLANNYACLINDRGVGLLPVGTTIAFDKIPWYVRAWVTSHPSIFIPMMVFDFIMGEWTIVDCKHEVGTDAFDEAYEAYWGKEVLLDLLTNRKLSRGELSCLISWNESVGLLQRMLSQTTTLTHRIRSFFILTALRFYGYVNQR